MEIAPHFDHTSRIRRLFARLRPPAFERKFERRAPAHQNAVDIFEGKWASDLGAVCPGLRSGEVALFADDTRPRILAERLGSAGRLDNLSVLELGPLEGGHTYQLEKLGAKRVLAIEANVEAFLKCLIVKEIAELRVARFMLGDFTEYLMTTEERFDIVMCCGVLYHQADPLQLIEAIARVTSKCFVWTHYFDASHYRGPPREVRPHPRYPGVKLYATVYRDMDYGRYWGGIQPVSAWLTRDDLLTAFKGAGFRSIEVLDDAPDHPGGTAITFTASRI
jgi:SAM-dependent methyltransferase